MLKLTLSSFCCLLHLLLPSTLFLSLLLLLLLLLVVSDAGLASTKPVQIQSDSQLAHSLQLLSLRNISAYYLAANTSESADQLGEKIWLQIYV